MRNPSLTILPSSTADPHLLRSPYDDLNLASRHPVILLWKDPHASIHVESEYVVLSLIHSFSLNSLTGFDVTSTRGNGNAAPSCTEFFCWIIIMPWRCFTGGLTLLIKCQLQFLSKHWLIQYVFTKLDNYFFFLIFLPVMSNQEQSRNIFSLWNKTILLFIWWVSSMQSNGRHMFSNLLFTSLIVETNFESMFIALLTVYIKIRWKWGAKKWNGGLKTDQKSHLVIFFIIKSIVLLLKNSFFYPWPTLTSKIFVEIGISYSCSLFFFL